MFSAKGGPAVTLIDPDGTAVNPLAPNRRVRGPIVPVIVRFVKVAVLPAVGTEVVPLRVPPPLAMATRTFTGVGGTTGFPDASWSWMTTGPKDAPFCTDPGGGVRMASLLPLPALSATASELTGVRALLEKLST